MSYNLGQAPLGVTNITIADGQIVENALALAVLEGLLPPEQVGRARLIQQHFKATGEASMRAHRAAGVPTAGEVIELRNLPVLGDVA